MNLKLHVRKIKLSLTVMNDEAHGVRLMLLCKTGKYSVMFFKRNWFTGSIHECTLKSYISLESE